MDGIKVGVGNGDRLIILFFYRVIFLSFKEKNIFKGYVVYGI